MTTSLKIPGAAFQSCVDEAIRQAPILIDRWAARLAEALYARSMTAPEPAERHQFQNVIMALKKNCLLLKTAFPVELEKSIADEFSAGSAQKTASSAGAVSSVSFDELELMQDDQVQEAVENARVQQVVRLGCEASLASFTARLSTARGFLVVKADSNPLRPEIMTQALLRTLRTLPVSSHTRTTWLINGAQILGQELQLMYVQLNEFLAAQGMAPAAYGVIPMITSWKKSLIRSSRTRCLLRSTCCPNLKKKPVAQNPPDLPNPRQHLRWPNCGPTSRRTQKAWASHWPLKWSA